MNLELQKMALAKKTLEDNASSACWLFQYIASAVRLARVFQLFIETLVDSGFLL
ncbi:MAG: hypothetical protein NWT00_08725 [Beijerinckiaceae bacterium]|nr:hypothetical protein [Beijerinckiaceae bacterium]